GRTAPSGQPGATSGASSETEASGRAPGPSGQSGSQARPRSAPASTTAWRSSPSSGARENLPDDAVRLREERVLERRAVRDRRVRRRDAPRVVEVAEPLLGDEREHLAGP